jgi:2-polyprenyl-6-hydroxyphenyl methylase/3-demethylubiquinone-9 3-methyltransferase
MTSKNTICLWHDGDAVEAAQFYAKTFPTARWAQSIARLATFPRAIGVTC